MQFPQRQAVGAPSAPPRVHTPPKPVRPVRTSGRLQPAQHDGDRNTPRTLGPEGRSMRQSATLPSRSARRAPETVTVRELLKREPGLKLEAAIVRALGENSCDRAGRLVRLPKQRGGDVADDRSGIVVIANVADLHRYGQ